MGHPPIRLVRASISSTVEAIVSRIERDAEVFLLKPIAKEQLGKLVVAEGHDDEAPFVARVYEVTEGNWKRYLTEWN